MYFVMYKYEILFCTYTHTQTQKKNMAKGNVYDDMMKLFVRVFAFDKVNKMAGIVML